MDSISIFMRFPLAMLRGPLKEIENCSSKFGDWKEECNKRYTGKVIIENAGRNASEIIEYRIVHINSEI